MEEEISQWLQAENDIINKGGRQFFGASRRERVHTRVRRQRLRCLHEAVEPEDPSGQEKPQGSELLELRASSRKESGVVLDESTISINTPEGSSN